MEKKESLIKMFLFTVFAVLVMIWILSRSFMTAQAQETASNVRERVQHTLYTGIKLRETDTLEGLAARYNDAAVQDNSVYIQEIIKINHLEGEKLHPGCYLTVKYYAD